MSFPLSSSGSPLQAPQALFSRPASPGPAPAEIRPAAPGLRRDLTQFSTVSRLVQHMPTLQLPPALRRLPDQILSGLDRGWQALKNTFVFQFGETGRAPGATAKEAQANCGPASAAMILKQFGVSAPTMHQMRRLVGAPIGSRSGAFALSTPQVAEAVKRSAAQQGARISYDIKHLTTNVDRTLDEMRRRLAAGEKLILLTSNIGTLSQGHYVVVKEVRNDGSIVVDDPGVRNGENRVHTRQELAKALSVRTQRYGRENSLIAFQRQR